MEEKDLIKLTEVDARSKSNSHQIDELKHEVKEIKKENKAIYELTTSVKLIVQDMSTIKDTVNEVKDGQKVLEDKMDMQISDVKQQIDKQDEKFKVDLWEAFKTKIFPFVFGGGCAYGVIEFVRSLIK